MIVGIEDLYFKIFLDLDPNLIIFSIRSPLKSLKEKEQSQYHHPKYRKNRLEVSNRSHHPNNSPKNNKSQRKSKSRLNKKEERNNLVQKLSPIILRV